MDPAEVNRWIAAAFENVANAISSTEIKPLTNYELEDILRRIAERLRGQ